MKVISTWYDTERKKHYQIRQYIDGVEVFVDLNVGWCKSCDIPPEDIKESKVWVKMSD